MKHLLMPYCRLSFCILFFGLNVCKLYSSEGSSGDSDSRAVEYIQELASSPDTRQVAIIESRQLLVVAERVGNNEMICALYRVLGDLEYQQVKQAEDNDHMQLMKRRGRSALIFYEKALSAGLLSDMSHDELAEILQSAVSVVSLIHDPDEAAQWLIELKQHSEMSTNEAFDAIHVALLKLSADSNDGTFLKSVNSLSGLWMSADSGLTDEISMSQLRGDALLSYLKVYAVPHEEYLLEVGVIIGVGLVALILVFLSRSFLGRSQHNIYSNCSLWQKSEWTSSEKVRACEYGEVVLTNLDSEQAVFTDYGQYESDPLTRRFIANASIPIYIIIIVVSLLGFGAIVLLNGIEGTLQSTSLIELSFFGSISDPINWAICVPLFCFFSRSFYRSIPHALNSFYENLLVEDQKEEMLSIIDDFNRRFNKTVFLVLILLAAFVVSAFGFIDLGQSVHIYGMQDSVGSLTESLASIGIFRIPTILGWFVIVALTILIYGLAVNFKQIFTVIFLFKKLYDRFENSMRVNPFHSDFCGGLSFAGSLSVRMILIASVAGLMGFDLVLRDVFIAGLEAQPYHMLMFPFYIVLMPVVFFFPVLHARRILLISYSDYRNKLNILSESLLGDFTNLLDTKDPDALIEGITDMAEQTGNFQSLYDQQFPTWPIRTQPVIAVSSAFLIPILLPILLEMLLA